MSVTEVTSPAPEPARTDAELVLAARATEPGAYRELFERWYDRCFDHARNVLQDQQAAGEVAQEAFGTGWAQLPDLRDPGAFGGWILRIAGNHALRRLEHEQQAGSAGPAADRPRSWASTDPDAEEAEWLEAHQLLRLVAGTLGARDLGLLDLHLRHGLPVAEIADELELGTGQAGELLLWLRSALRDAIGAALLWGDGEPPCAVLATVVPARFDAECASVIRRHQRRCGTCSALLRQHGDLEELFVTIPYAVVPLRVKTLAVLALFESGVPVVTDGPAGGRAEPGLPGVRARPAGGVGPAVLAWVAAHPVVAAATLVLAVLAGVAAISLLP